MNKWQTKKINEICSIKSSKRIYAREYVDSGVPFYRSKEIIQKSKSENITQPLFISESKFNEIDSQFGSPKTGDILLTAVGTIGIPYYVTDQDKFYFKDGNLIWLSDFSGFLGAFLYYWIKSDLGRKQIDKVLIGSSQSALTLSSMRDIDIDVPSITAQEEIVNILSSIDYKIEINRKINDSLKGIGRLLFQHWFIHFEFPWDFTKNEFSWNGKPYKSSGGEMVKSELGEIPKGWEVANIEDVSIDLSRGSSINYTDSSNGIPVLNQRCVRNGGISLKAIKYAKKLSENKKNLYLQLNDILINSMGVGTLGRISRNLSIEYPIIIHNCITLVRANKEKISPNILYYFVKLQENVFTNLGEGTSGQTSLKIEIIKETKILVPIKNIQNYFDSIVGPTIKQNGLLKNNNINLAKIRDLLLPRLMSGKLRVSVNK